MLGVSIISKNENKSFYSRAYLITKEQFEDVVAQENGKTVGKMKIKFDEIIEKKHVQLISSNYGLCMFLGKKKLIN